MLGIPLSEENEKTSKFGRWVRKTTAATSLVSAPLILGGGYLFEGVLQPNLEEANRGPIRGTVQVPDPHLQENLGEICQANGKNWQDFVRVQIQHQGNSAGTVVFPCALGKSRG